MPRVVSVEENIYIYIRLTVEDLEVLAAKPLSEAVQVCVREARLSVAPAIYSEPKPEPKLVRGKMAS